MKYNSKKVLTIFAMICIIIGMSGNCFAHSGRTDSSGGHKDNQNKSGLGSYHYHCGGNPPHLHDNGVCPYSSSSSSYSSTSSTNKSSTSSSTKSSSSDSVTTSSASVKTETKEEVIVKASSIKINESITNMKVGETENLTVIISPTDTKDKSITWSSNDEDIATVSSTGKVVALKAGVVKITATTENEKMDTIKIIVEEENNNIVVPNQNNELNNISTNNSEDSNVIGSVLGAGLIGGGAYWGYKKYKNKKGEN